MFNKKSRIIITCSKRLSPCLEKELLELGYQARMFVTGAELSGSLQDCIRLNLNLRCASQILYSLSEFRAESANDLYKAASAISWEDIIPADGYFSITSQVNTPSVNTELFANVKIKDAIADRMRGKTGSRPDSGSDSGKTVIHLFWKDEKAEIFIDTSGHSLSKHGYRKFPGAAPLLESLASALIIAGKWNRTSPFINPMCGSGTLAIEAACIATNRRPGLYRNNYAFMHVIGYDDEIYQNEIEKLEKGISEIAGLKIVASDYSPDAIGITRSNAERAGVDHLIDFETCDFMETTVPEKGGGVVYFNPGYGERLGDNTELEEVYAGMGDFMKKKCRGYTGYIFTGNIDLAKKIGLRASRRIEFYNATIDCRLLEYELYEGSRRQETVTGKLEA